MLSKCVLVKCILYTCICVCMCFNVMKNLYTFEIPLIQGKKSKLRADAYSTWIIATLATF